MKIIYLTAILLCCVTFAEAKSLPEQVTDYLNKTYSGWSFSNRSVNCNTATTNSRLSLDFDRNGKADWAVKIKRGNKGYIIAFVNNGKGYQPFVLESKAQNGGNNDIDDTAMDISSGKLRVTNCEVSSYFYLYKNRRFTRKFISD